jgi:hypothetical protein
MEQVLEAFTFRGGTIRVRVWFNTGLGRYRCSVPHRKDTVFADNRKSMGYMAPGVCVGSRGKAHPKRGTGRLNA